jgi:hypothetical protein
MTTPSHDHVPGTVWDPERRLLRVPDQRESLVRTRCHGLDIRDEKSIIRGGP